MPPSMLTCCTFYLHNVSHTPYTRPIKAIYSKMPLFFKAFSVCNKVLGVLVY